MVSKKTADKSVERIREDQEPKEVKLAKIGFKQAIVVALITSIVAIVGTISVALITKSAEKIAETSNVNEEVQYLDETAKTAIDELKARGGELSNASSELQEKIDKEQNPTEKNRLIQEKKKIDDAIKFNNESGEAVKQKTQELLEAKKEGLNVRAAILRKKANDIIVKEGNERQKIIEIPKKEGLSTDIKELTIPLSHTVITKIVTVEKGHKPQKVQKSLKKGVWIWSTESDEGIEMGFFDSPCKAINSLDVWVTNKIDLEYPSETKEKGKETIVKVQMVIDIDKGVIGAVSKEGDPAIKQASIEAAHKLKFKPSMFKGSYGTICGAVNIKFLPRK